jgi:hypothetical protein
MAKRKGHPLGILGNLDHLLPPPSPPPAAGPAHPLAHLFPPVLSAAERDRERDRWKKVRQRAIAELGLSPDVSDAELFAAADREQRLNEREGAKMRQRRKKGAAVRNAAIAPALIERNHAMTQEYLQRQPTSKLKPSPLKAKIGKKRGLSRSQAIAVIDAELKKIVR